MIPFHEVSSAPGTARVLLSGEIDMAIQEELRDVLRAVLASSPGVIEVDLSHVTFLDCTAIGELIQARLDASRHGQILVVTRPRGFVRTVLQFANVLPLLTSRPTALIGRDA